MYIDEYPFLSEETCLPWISEPQDIALSNFISVTLPSRMFCKASVAGSPIFTLFAAKLFISSW